MENQNKPIRRPATTPGKPASSTTPGAVKKEKVVVTDRKGGGSKAPLILFIILTVALAVVSILLYLKLGDKDEKIAELESRVDSGQKMIVEKDEKIGNQEKELEDIMTRLKRVRDEREKLGLENEDLNQKIATIQRSLSKVRSSYYKTKAEKEKLEDMIGQLRQESLTMQAELEEWKTRADSLGITVQELETENMRMTQQNDSLMSLSQAASVLRAENIDVSVINEKGKEYTDKDEYKAKQVSKVKVTFNLAENNVAAKDDKDILLKVSEPSGTVLFDLKTGGGSFAKADGRQDFYSSKSTIKFKNTKQPVTFLYDKGSEYTPGTYRIEIFAEGYLIGKTAFQIK